MTSRLIMSVLLVRSGNIRNENLNFTVEVTGDLDKWIWWGEVQGMKARLACVQEWQYHLDYMLAPEVEHESHQTLRYNFQFIENMRAGGMSQKQEKSK